MPIERGQEWGHEGELPPGSRDAGDDAAVAAAIISGDTHVRPLAGDLARTVGVTAASLARTERMLLPVDALEVRLDGGAARIAAAHVRIGPSARPEALVMNAAFLGPWNPAPRAHPGDGRFDVVEFDLGLVDWFKARRRLPTGTHVPHPDIKMRSLSAWSRAFDAPKACSLDGARAVRARRIEVAIVSEAIVIGV